MTKNITLNYDAFSEGQVRSKIWLCEQLEKINVHPTPRIWILGGWCGVLGFLLLSRNRMSIGKIRSWDIDPACENIADRINNTWVIQHWKFKAHTMNVNELDYEDVDIVINTSTEHMDSDEWFENIPQNTLVCLQGNNMNHDDHTSNTHSLEEFRSQYPLAVILYEGELKFEYNDWGFTRYMIIGYR